MGAYINPPDGSPKEDFLKEHGLPVDFGAFSWDSRPENCLPVVLVDNGLFTAAGICYDEREFGVFTNPNDRRPRNFYYVEIEKLYDVSNLQTYLPRQGEETASISW